jgi:hypothetical protein
VLKKCLFAVRDALRTEKPVDPFAVYATIDLGPGGCAVAPARKAKQAIRAIVRRKTKRR